jgi:hypothetical protein
MRVFPKLEMLLPLFRSPANQKQLGKDDQAPTKQQRRTLGIWDGQAAEQKQCLLFTKLPAEIRNEVYEYAVTAVYIQGANERMTVMYEKRRMGK